MKIKIGVFQAIACLVILSKWSFGQDDVTRIQELLAKAQKVPAYQCDMVTSSFIVVKTQPTKSAPPAMSKIWRKGPYSKTDTDFGYAMVTGPDGAYDYFVGKDQYSRHKGSFGPPLTEFAPFVEDKNCKLAILGNEAVNGMNCTVVNVVERKNPKPGVSLSTKYWIWKDNGLIVKIEQTIKNGHTISKMLTEAKNFRFGDIPDDVFAVPKEKVVNNNSDTAPK